MLNARNLTLCAYVLSIYGPAHQLIKLNEEMAELNQEVCKILLTEGPMRPTEHFKEELADVAVMVQQAAMMCGISEQEINERALAKLERTIKERLKEKSRDEADTDEAGNPGETPDKEKLPADNESRE